jgi:hypothetical protein
MVRLELISVGDDIGVIFPEALCAKLGVALGDNVYMTPMPNGFSLHSELKEVIIDTEARPYGEALQQK